MRSLIVLKPKRSKSASVRGTSAPFQASASRVDDFAAIGASAETVARRFERKATSR
jgi:hypothetical protein